MANPLDRNLDDLIAERGGGGCHNCGKPGHFARECPAKGAGGGGGGACHTCGKPGHFSRECPQGGGGGGGGATGACHTCGRVGHKARDCTAGGGFKATAAPRAGAGRGLDSARPFGGPGVGIKHKIIVSGPGADSLSDADLAEIFSSDGYRVRTAEMALSREGRKQGFVEFANAESVDRACRDFDKAEINGRVINVRAISGGGGGGGGGEGTITVVKRGGAAASQAAVRVENLPQGITEGELQSIFDSLGGYIAGSRVFSGRRGVTGEVTWEGANAAALAKKAVAEFHGALVNDAEIRVTLA